MKPERKKEIRSLIHTIPTLIKAHMVNQAFETEKVIAATFDLSEPFLEILGGKVPPNHIDKIQEIYSDLLYKAFNVGLKSGEIKSKSMTIDPALQGVELDHELDIKMPMYFGVKQDTLTLFREQLGDILKSIPDIKENLIMQFDRDMEGAYRDGLKEYLSLNISTEPVSEKEEEEGEGFEEDFEASADDNLDEENDEIDMGNEDEVDLGDDARLEALEDELNDVEEKPEIEEETEENENKEKLKANVVGSLDATAITAFKVWEKYASPELKELFKVQAQSSKHKENAQMVYEFNDWLIKGSKAEFYIPFESNIVKNDVDRTVIQRLEKYAKLLKNSTAEKVLRYTLGLPVKKAEGAFNLATEKEKSENADSGIISKLEAYTKLLKDPTAEKVLRYTLGLPIKKVSAATQKMIGPYDAGLLRNKILGSLKSHSIVEADVDNYQNIVVDCVLSGIDDMPKEKALQQLNKVLEIRASSFFEFDQKADVLAQKLDAALQLPGEVVFVNLDGDYCLTYNIKPDDLNRIQAKKDKENPFQKKISTEDMRQIECLSRLSKSKTIRDINKASEKVANYLKRILSDIRFGRVGIVEGSFQLNANLEDIVAEVFGTQGLKHFKYLNQ